MTRKATRGECTICGKVLGKRAMTSHLRTHFPTGSAFHLLVDTRHGSEYWMHLQSRGDATLKDLDSFLREEWLECCDHMTHL